MTISNALDATETLTGLSGNDRLLGVLDPSPVDVHNAQSTAPFVLLCEHAGQAVPDCLDRLGLPAAAFDRHIGWDIGAEKLARAISDHLGCPLIVQRYSRLVIDCNRPPGSRDSIPEQSDGVTVPGNAGLTDAARALRKREIFDPMNDALAAAFDSHPRQATFSIHSYTRSFQGTTRPWDAGFLTRRDPQTAGHLMSTLSAAAPELNLALNQPYQIDDTSDWFIPQHAEARGLRHTLIEICNDHLEDAAGVARWADLLAGAIRTLLEDTP